MIISRSSGISKTVGVGLLKSSLSVAMICGFAFLIQSLFVMRFLSLSLLESAFFFNLRRILRARRLSVRKFVILLQSPSVEREYRAVLCTRNVDHKLQRDP